MSVPAPYIPPALHLTRPAFDLFWSTFPRKIGKGAAELTWKSSSQMLRCKPYHQAVKAQCKASNGDGTRASSSASGHVVERQTVGG